MEYKFGSGITNALELKRRAVEDYEATISELQQERQEILSACAHFGLFLKENSILPYNDAMEGYLTLMIKEEMEKAQQSMV